MAVYMVFNEQITDQGKFETYRQQAGALILRYGGRSGPRRQRDIAGGQPRTSSRGHYSVR